MKKLTIFILIAGILASCKPESKESCLISGSVKNAPANELIRLTLGTRVDTIKLNADGTFSKEISLAKPGYAMLQGSKYYLTLFLIPGTDLSVSADASDFNKDLALTGSMAPENNFLLRLSAGEQKTYEALNIAYRAPNTPADFKRVADSVRAADLAELERYADSVKVAESFLEKQRTSIQFGYYEKLSNYPTVAGYFNTAKPEIPADWFNFLDGVNLDDPTLLDIPDAKSLIQSHIGNQARKISGVSSEDSYNNLDVMRAANTYLKENFKNPEFYNLMVFESLKGYIDSEGPADVQEMVNEYMTVSNDAENKKILQAMVDGWATMAPGQPAPVFNLPDIDGKMVSLTDFAGKYVFIDYWATWCGPCKMEIPYYKQLIEDYKDKNIVFISISVDKDKAAWEKMVKEGIPDPMDQTRMIQMTWLQLHDAIRYNKIWLVKFIPTFVLIDPQGKIVDARAGRPSDPELRKTLEALPGI